tara:strand:- start:432 stop:593 length:162 start_codon:yes stop_codon:yes gene_type:complete
MSSKFTSPFMARSPLKAKCPPGWTLNPNPKGKPCLPPKKEQSAPTKGKRKKEY